MREISPVHVPQTLPNPLGRTSSTSEAGKAFGDLLLGSLSQVNQMQHDAEHAVQALFTGGDVDAAEVLTAVQKADMAFQLTMQIRNKLMQAYQEIKDIRI